MYALKLLITGIAISLFPITSYCQQWSQLGPSESQLPSSGSAAAYTNLAGGPDGLPFLIFRDGSNANKATVKKYNKSLQTWDIVGEPGFSTGNVTYTVVAVDNNNVPYAAYQDSSVNKLVVKKFDSTSNKWELVGSEGISQGAATYISIVSDKNNVVYVAYSDEGNNSKATVKMFNTSTGAWELVGMEGFSGSIARYLSLAVNTDNAFYLAYQDESEGNRATVKHYNKLTSSWEAVGSNGFTTGTASFTSLAISTDNALYLAYQDGANNSKANVQIYNVATATWDILGSAGFSVGSALYTAIAVDKDNVPYVAYLDGSVSSRITLNKFNKAKSVWELTNSAFSVGSVKYTSLLITDSNDIFVSYQDAGLNNQAAVKTLHRDLAQWETVGFANISASSAAAFTAIAVDGIGTPYITYRDEGNYGKAVAKKYLQATSSWQTLGDNEISKGGSAYNSISVSDSGDVYVAYQDDGYFNKISVKKLSRDSTTWLTVGTEAFSAGKADYTTIVSDNNNIPYVIYKDAGAGNKAIVKRYNTLSAQWEFVGTAVSGSSADYTTIAFDSNNKLYASFVENSKVSVKQFNQASSAWEVVGSAGFSLESAQYLSLAIDNNNVPFVAYSDLAYNERATVKRYNSGNNAWETLGMDGFSNNAAGFVSMALTGNGIPVVVYRDGTRANKTTAKSFNPTSGTWETLGPEGFSLGGTAYSNLISDKTGKMFLVYRDGGAGSAAVVKQLNATAGSWQLTGQTGISAGSKASFTKLAVDKTGNPYLIYRNEKNAGKADAKFYNKDIKAWENLGQEGFTVESASYMAITLNSQDVPYAAFVSNADNKAYVKRFNRSINAWEALGPAISSANVSDINLAADSNDDLYISYQLASGKLSVKVYNNTSSLWENLGADGFTTNTGKYSNLGIDNSNVPYIVYQDGNKSNKLTVKRFNALTSLWENVGTEGFSAGVASHSSISFDSDDNVYVAYQDGAVANRITVKRFNTATQIWDNVGPQGISAGSASFISLIINSAGQPFVLFRDGANFEKATVKKYNSGLSSWENVGGLGFSIGAVSFSNLQETEDGKIFAAYTDAGTGFQAEIMTLNTKSLSWEDVGTDASGGTSVSSVSLALSGNKTPYIAYQDERTGNAAVVRRFNATKSIWETIGNAKISTGKATYTNFALANDSVPVVVYRDASRANKATVKKFNYLTTKWDALDTAGTSSGAVAYTAIAVNKENIPYIAYQDSISKNKLTVKRFTGTAWELVGSAGISTGGAAFTSIKFNSGNVPYIAYQDSASGSKVVVKSFNAATSKWEDAGTSTASLSSARFPSIVIDDQDIPWIVYQDNTGKLTVQKFDTAKSEWSIVGPPSFSLGSASFPSLTVDNSGTPWVTYQDNANLNKTTVQVYNSDKELWEIKGKPGISAGAGLLVATQQGTNNTPFLAFRDDGKGGQIILKQLSSNSSEWEPLSSPALSSGYPTQFASLSAGNDELPYVAYRDGAAGNKVAVKKFNKQKATWESVGVQGFTDSKVDYVSIAAGSDNVPYVIYRDDNTKATVKRYNSATSIWETLGVASFTGPDVRFTTIVINAGNVPYVGYRDGGAGGKATVKKFNSVTGAWEDVGTPGFSEGGANFVSIAFDKITGAPYTVYQDESLQNKISVKLYNAGTNSWDLVGAAGFSPGSVNNPQIKVGADNRPVVVFADNVNGSRLTSQKYNPATSTWEILGTVGFTPGSAANPSVAFDSENNLNVAFMEGSAGSRVSLMKFKADDHSWTYTSNNISIGASNYNTLLYTPSGEGYLAYQDAGFGNQIVVKQLVNSISAWENVGTSGISSGTSSNFTSLAVKADNTPLIAYQETGASNKAVVKQLNTGTLRWETLGTAGISKGAGTYTAVALDNTDKPYLIYADGGLFNKAVVKSFNATSKQWEAVGTEGISAGATSFNSIALSKDNEVFIAYRDAEKSNKAIVKHFANSAWEELGSAGASDSAASYISLAIDKQKIPYVAYQNSKDSSKVTVKRFNNSAWEAVGTASISSGPATFINLTIDSTNAPVVIYVDAKKLNKAVVKKFNRTSSKWELIGPEGFTAGTGFYPSLAVDKDNVLYAAYQDAAKSNRLTAKKYDVQASAWVTVGTAGFSSSAAGYSSIAINKNNKVFTAFKDNSYPTVKQLNETSVSLDPSGISGISSGAPSAYTSIDLASDNTPYIIFQDAGVGNAATVKKFNSLKTRWETVGSQGISQGVSLFTSLKVGKSDELFAVYRDAGNSGKATVKKFNTAALSWESVGGEGLSIRGANFISFQLDSNNTPFVAYQDEWNLNKTTVRRFNNKTGNWQNVGSEGFSAGTANYVSVALDRTANPWVIYQDAVNQNKATVKHYNKLKNAWETAGPEGFTSGEAAYTGIALDQNNVPYVVYQDVTSGKATVKRFDAEKSEWELVGEEGFTGGSADYTSIYFDKYNLPYVIYRNSADGNKIALSRFNIITSKWEIVGEKSFSAGAGTFPALAIGSDNTPYAVYSSGQAFVQKFDCGQSFAVQNIDTSVCKDANAGFAISIAGNSNSYLWQVDKGNGFESLKKDSIYSGVNTDRLKIASSSPALHNNKYRCLVIGSCVNVSNEGKLTVNEYHVNFETTSLEKAIESKSYKQILAGKGGVAPYNYSILSGSLPQGLTLSADGTISGTPEQVGDYSFTVGITESSICKTASTVNFTINVDSITADMVNIHPVVTPDGDGINDYLTIPGIERFSENHVVIVNRNGATVFETRNYDNQNNVFKGTFKAGSENVPQGTYFYLLEFKVDGKLRRKTGYLVVKYN